MALLVTMTAGAMTVWPLLPAGPGRLSYGLAALFVACVLGVLPRRPRVVTFLALLAGALAYAATR